MCILCKLGIPHETIRFCVLFLKCWKYFRCHLLSTFNQRYTADSDLIVLNIVLMEFRHIKIGGSHRTISCYHHMFISSVRFWNTGKIKISIRQYLIQFEMLFPNYGSIFNIKIPGCKEWYHMNICKCVYFLSLGHLQTYGNKDWCIMQITCCRVDTSVSWFKHGTHYLSSKAGVGSLILPLRQSKDTVCLRCFDTAMRFVIGVIRVIFLQIPSTGY